MARAKESLFAMFTQVSTESNDKAQPPVLKAIIRTARRKGDWCRLGIEFIEIKTLRRGHWRRITSREIKPL